MHASCGETWKRRSARFFFFRNDRAQMKWASKKWVCSIIGGLLMLL
jgi:hypothetical protein